MLQPVPEWEALRKERVADHVSGLFWWCQVCGTRPALPEPRGQFLCRLHGGTMPGPVIYRNKRKGRPKGIGTWGTRRPKP